MIRTYSLFLDDYDWICEVSNKDPYPAVSIDFYRIERPVLSVHSTLGIPAIHCVKNTDDLMEQYSSGEEAVRRILEDVLRKNEEVNKEMNILNIKRRNFWN